MEKKFVATEISIILFDEDEDILMMSGEDDAIVKDGSWANGTQSGSGFGS